MMPITDMIKLSAYFLNNPAYVIGGSTLTTYCVLLGIRRGMSLTRAAQMLTMLQVSNAISRFLVAAVGDRRWFPRHLVLGFTPFVGGIISLMLLRAETVWAFALCCVLYGTSYGVRASMQTPILVDLFGIQNLPMVQSIYILFGGIGILTGPVAAGFLMDRYTGDLRPVFILSGISCIVSGVLQGGALCINYRQKRASEEPPKLGRSDTQDTILEETRF
ncbi:PREDICTED: monocarboxylate transporter 3-like [Priapulus caudatus]|uniref:Monocarboxylate transporter 3-like n=1 Tax=Priapulus caudatus TaxID=37621 RepID=A0ABM1F5D4_PRICU|nr:PREDICTED: monocarboxylate transporter 3-like [Priapulus caudatus]